MVVAEIKMNKPVLKVSVSDNDSSESEESEGTRSDEEIEDESIETDADSGTLSNEDNSNSELLMTNEGWADSVVKILGTSKPKNKKTLVLSRAKKYSEVKKEIVEKPSFEVIGEQKQEKNDIKAEEVTTSDPPPKRKKHEKASIRLKPNILDKDRERVLSKIATKGVVQLFNAVRNQQKVLDKELEGNDISESKKEKVLKKFDKRTFLDRLMGPTKSVVVDEVRTMKNEVKNEDTPKWSALREDFMTGAKMKDWDKETTEE